MDIEEKAWIKSRLERSYSSQRDLIRLEKKLAAAGSPVRGDLTRENVATAIARMDAQGSADDAVLAELGRLALDSIERTAEETDSA